MKTELPDGLYRVATSYLCAGFVVEGGQVTMCAPSLRRRFRYWERMAERVEEGETESSGDLLRSSQTPDRVGSERTAFGVNGSD